ncbi:MAG: nucleotide exchange factor GrpE [Candidatus Gracilibacteria bacterium]
MTKHDKKTTPEEVEKILEEELVNDEGIIDENKINEEIIESESVDADSECSKLKEAFTRQQADFNNFKKRVERDREDMIFFLKADILKKILPRIDDLQRIILQTPDDQKKGTVYTGIISIEKKLLQDLERMGVKAFDSKGDQINIEKHEVMTQIPGEEGIILDEFEKGYMIGDRVLRVAKVVVGQG